MGFIFKIKRKIKYIGIKNSIYYFFFQRILRINSHVPWPVHHASVVSYPERIKREFWRPYPGYLSGQYFQAKNGIVIGKNVRLGPGVKVISASHNVDNYDLHDKAKPIIIGDNCWLAANVVVLPGVELGNHIVVAAGAVVNKSFPEGNCVIGGVPAKIIKKLGPYLGDSSW